MSSGIRDSSSESGVWRIGSMDSGNTVVASAPVWCEIGATTGDGAVLLGATGTTTGVMPACDAGLLGSEKLTTVDSGRIRLDDSAPVRRALATSASTPPAGVESSCSASARSATACTEPGCMALCAITGEAWAAPAAAPITPAFMAPSVSATFLCSTYLSTAFCPS